MVSFDMDAQVRKTFTQRTAAATPSKVIYNIKGDFTMIGNTNLTLKTYSPTSNNNNNAMIYVDVDNDSNTYNSSSSTLALSTENGANPNCSNILFAGLYWTGKSQDADSFTASKQVQTGTQTVNNNYTVVNNDNITNTNYSLSVSRNNGGNNNNSPIYTFSGNGNTYVFNYTNNASPNTVTLSINGGALTSIPVSIVTSGSTATATLTTPYSITDGTVTLKINQLIRSTSVTLNTPDTQSTSSSIVNVSGTVPTYTTLTKTMNKNNVSIKGPLASNYTTLTASATDIYYPGAADDGIFVGFKEVTDYVKTNGIGEYFVADIALSEGVGPGTGYSGGWGMIIVYENQLMKSRDVTIFDGYTYMSSSVGSATIPISGFKAILAGQVNMKLGVIASEGDVSFTGDFLQLQQLNTATYIDLSHSGNTTTNFFNSSIYNPGISRNPNLVNNTGMDISMFNVPNTGNINIANGQTSTIFKYGTNSDTYSIFAFGMAVDSYVPEPEGILVVNSINAVTNPPQPYNVLPGQEISYTLNIKNKGTEAINNNIVTIPISNTINFLVGSITSTKNSTVTTTNIPYYDSATQSIIWDMGTLPLPADPNTLLASITFKVKATDDCAIIINNSCNSIISVSGTINGTGAISGVATNKAIFKGFDTSTGCQIPITSPTTVALDNSGSPCFSALAGPDQLVSCGGEKVNLNATSGTIGSWSIISGPAGGGEIFSNDTSTNSTFYSPNFGNYLLRWTTSCAGTKDEVLVSFVPCNILNFDGIDDNVTFKNNYSLSTGSFSVETWVKSNATNGNKQTIFSKRVGTSTADGYDLKLVNNIISFNWNNGNTIASNFAINTDRWYHVAVTFNGSNYKLYIDGIPVQNAVSGVNPILNNSANCILGAMDQSSGIPFNYFNGWMDELRIWKVELTVDQIRQMMNQEILNNGGNVKGAIVPLDVPGLTWTNLDGYYQMNPVNDVVNGFVLGKSTSAINGKLRNIGTQQPDTAPLPYTSRISNQDWSIDDTWTNYPVWDVPNSLAIDGTTRIDWNIVKTDHKISSTGNKKVLGLLVNTNTVSAENDSKIEVSHYLKINGKIDLVGKSQLIQTEGSILDVASSGSLERDQQGQSNKYNYNYWSSPVSPVNTTANNTDYTVGGVLKDGTNAASPATINWVGGYDGSPTTPISLARYWVYKFDNYANAYANWVQIGETGSLRVGQGFTLKGSGAAGTTQNYTFIGKPNNGTIATNTVSSDQLLLTGNPYPSALDANAFINDNSTSIDGTLYFWEHYTTNNTHILRDYQGGYAERNLTGGVPPTSIGVDFISGLGATTRSIPNQFIPVGQSFFVNGKIGSTTTTVTYKNSQRGFIKENESTSNIMFKTKSSKDKYWNNNESDKVENNNYKKIRLGFDSNNTAHRQVLLGFMDEKATIEMDYGYDGLNFDEYPNDMYFMCGENQLVIQGVSSFDKNSSYPIGVKADTIGKVKFMIDGLENFDSSQPIYIHDNEDDTYHNIRIKEFEVNLPKGENNSRFSLRFIDKNKKEETVTNTNNEITVAFLNNSKILQINNNALEEKVLNATLYNMNGQTISKWEIKNQGQQNIQLPVKKISSGIYIVKIKTSDGEINKKIIVP
tara:strand:- start:782 stop:5602 length:4821 start_codon:yes stop_codon:yes gene_type:complete